MNDLTVKATDLTGVTIAATIDDKTYSQWRQEAIETLENALPPKTVFDGFNAGVFPNKEAAITIVDAIIKATLCYQSYPLR